MKQLIGRAVSEVLFYLGHWIHFPMIWFDWAWMHGPYSYLMTWSHAAQVWAGNDAPWQVNHTQQDTE
jgi:hypothetical protein